MFSVPTPLHQRLVGSRLCPNPTLTQSEKLVHRASCSGIFSMMAGLALGAAVTYGVMTDSKLGKSFAALVALGASGVVIREHLKQDTALFVLQNRARLGEQSIYRYQGPGHDY